MALWGMGVWFRKSLACQTAGRLFACVSKISVFRELWRDLEHQPLN